MHSNAKTAVVVGARTERQGTGPFIATGLAAAGVSVTGIVGTSETSVARAQQSLQQHWQLTPAGFTSIRDAVTALQPDAVAICSPWAVHAEQLQAVAELGCHCLVEKPMAWPASAAEVQALIEAFASRGRLLQVVNQWPTTLAAFRELHGDVPSSIEQFQMRLSPISIGHDMITDSAPHFVGMLQALCGEGDCRDVTVSHAPAPDGEQALAVHCRYTHAGGDCDATLTLQTQQRRPRPAWYQINELRADREVELPAYHQFLCCDHRKVPVVDPMQCVAADFAAALRDGRCTDGARLMACHRNLEQLALAPLPF